MMLKFEKLFVGLLVQTISTEVNLKSQVGLCPKNLERATT